MNKVAGLALALLCFSSEVYAGAGGGAPGQATADGLIEFDPPQAVACIAIRVEVPETKMVTGLRWFNGSSSEAFPEVLVASGNGMVPPPVAEAVVADSLVSGLHYQWSEITFNDPAASQSGTLFILLKYPTNYDPAPGTDALGVGYANRESVAHYYVTGDGVKWIKVSMSCRILLEPILADLVPGVVTLRARGDDEAEPVPVNKVGLFTAPNPFNPQTQIELYLPEVGTGNVKIYDIRGRMVVELYHGLFAIGRNSFVWRGQDSNGWPVASGVYYVKAKTDVKSFTHKLLLLK